jgi:L-fuculose-phosphate aldolase
MFPNELQARKDIVYYSHKTHAAGLVSATDGNLSVRLDADHILITPSSLRKEDMFIEAPIVINMNGEVVAGDRKPSTEHKVHLEAYRQRPDIGAVIHAHPPKAIAFTIAEVPLDTCMLPEVVVTMGNVPIAPYAAPSTDALPESMRELIQQADVLMLARHGSVTVGPNLADAFKKLEKLEHNAEIMIYARILGGPKPFSRGQLEELQNLRSFYGITTQQIACATPNAANGTIQPVATKPYRPSATSPRGPYDDGEAQAPTYRSTGGGHETEIDALVNEIVARVKDRL